MLTANPTTGNTVPSFNKNSVIQQERGTMKTGLIYKYTSKTTGKSYIGKSMEYRFKYRQKLHESDTSNTHFARAKRKYGYNDFELTILEDKIHKDILSLRETYWIWYYDSFNSGYNSTIGGEGGNTYAKRTTEQMEETKEKIRKSNSGDNNGIAKNPWLVQGENNGMYGKKPHNALEIFLKNIKTNEITRFDRAFRAANFLGYKGGNVISKMRKNNKMVVNDWILIEEGVETIESIAYCREDN